MSKLMKVEDGIWTVVCTHCHETATFHAEDGEFAARRAGWFPRRSIEDGKRTRGFKWTCPTCCAISDIWASVASWYGYDVDFAYEAFQRQMARDVRGAE